MYGMQEGGCEVKKEICRPLSWILTTNKKRDQGIAHLEKMVKDGDHTFVHAACGARPFAFSGSFPEDHPSVSQKCWRCHAIAHGLRPASGKSRLKKGTMQCPACSSGFLWHQVGGMILKSEASDGVMVYDAKCPKCGLHFEVPAQ
jgi:DNA-directed RNA polymerase subunit RPC12/RpoP